MFADAETDLDAAMLNLRRSLNMRLMLKPLLKNAADADGSGVMHCQAARAPRKQI